MDLEMVKAIVEWLVPKTTFDVHSLHELVSFYRKFMRNLNKICSIPLTDMKKGEFKWIFFCTKWI